MPHFLVTLSIEADTIVNVRILSEKVCDLLDATGYDALIYQTLAESPEGPTATLKNALK